MSKDCEHKTCNAAGLCRYCDEGKTKSQIEAEDKLYEVIRKCGEAQSTKDIFKLIVPWLASEGFKAYVQGEMCSGALIAIQGTTCIKLEVAELDEEEIERITPMVED